MMQKILLNKNIVITCIRSVFLEIFVIEVCMLNVMKVGLFQLKYQEFVSVVLC